MKIYRCVLWCLLIIFLVVAIIYVAYFYSEQSSNNEGTLIWRGVNVTGYNIC